MVVELNYTHRIRVLPIILLLLGSLLVHVKAFAALSRSSLHAGHYGLHDPTRPVEQRAGIKVASPTNLGSPGQSNLVLTAVFSSKQRKIAIINGQMLHVGDAIDAYTVDGIGSDYVTVRNKKGKRVTLSPRPTALNIRTVMKKP